MQCEICGSSALSVTEMPHRILGPSDLVICKGCGHGAFYPKKEERRKDDFIAVEYSKSEQHSINLLSTFKTRKYFIDFSRLVLLTHFKFLADGMKVLEIGPGFPGMFQQLKLTKRKLDFYAIEPASLARRLLKNYGVNVIANCFPLKEYNSYSGPFDVIFVCNVLYLFDNPILALRQMLELLKGDGIVLIDIINNKILDDEYYKTINTMTHIFSKGSLPVAVEKAGGMIKFLDTCCMKDPKNAFENIVSKNGDTIIKKALNRVKDKLGILSNDEIMNYFAQVTQLKYGNPEGQYIRAVIGKKTPQFKVE